MANLAPLVRKNAIQAKTLDKETILTCIQQSSQLKESRSMQNYEKSKEVERVLNVHNLIRANLYKVKKLNSLILQDYLDASHLKKMIQGFWVHALREVLYFQQLASLVHKIRVKRFREYMFMKKIRIL